MDYATKVRELFLHSLFTPEATEEERKTAHIVHGITMDVGFNPERIKEVKPELVLLLKELLPESFLSENGGGMSFMELLFTKSGDHWGDHAACEELTVLAIGVGLAKYSLPRNLWSLLPGGLPYVMFELE